jgi:nucleoside-diphosphate-sugar epimerase
VGGSFNIRDGRLVTRQEYLTTVAEYLGKETPGRVPLWLARAGVPVLAGWSRLRGSSQPPLLSRATIKFMALNLDFSIERARRVLHYEPRIDFQEGMREALAWAVPRQPAANVDHAIAPTGTGKDVAN